MQFEPGERSLGSFFIAIKKWAELTAQTESKKKPYKGA